MPQVITTQDSDSKGNIIHTETEASVVTYKDDNTVENKLDELDGREELFINEKKPTKKGFWINKSEQVVGKGSNTIVDRLKKYMDSKIGILSGLLTKNKMNVVQAINEVYENPSNINLIKNGGFQINTLGKSEYSKNSKQCLDCWELINRNNENTQDVGKVIVHDGCIELTEFGNKQLFIIQLLEDFEFYKIIGKKVTLSCDLKASNMTTGGIFLQCSYKDSTGKGKDFKTVINNKELQDEWKNFKFTLEETNDIFRDFGALIGSYFETKTGYLDMPNSDSSLFIRNVKLELGDRATPFIHKSYEEEFNNCLPYRNVLSNSNILINGNFKNLINQRKRAQYNSRGYSIDRWRLSNGGIELKVNNGFITLTTLNEVSGCECEQFIEFPSELSGKSVTISFKYKTASKYFKLFVHSFEKGNIGNIENDKLIKDGNWHEVSSTINIPILTTDNKFKIGFQFLGEPSFPKGEIANIEWVKLELGSVATPFVPRPYGEELALCQRYYQQGKFGFSFGTGDDSLKGGNINFYSPMRVAPTLCVCDEAGNIGKWDYTLPSGSTENNSLAGFVGVNDNLGLRAFHNYSDKYVGFSFNWKADAEIY